MDISKLGSNIRLLREEKGLTREQLCEEEKELSVRQLMRIENGVSTPTLAKVIYIAKRLDMSVTKLFDMSENAGIVPQGYWTLKQEIENYSSFDEKENESRIAILMKIYDNYYDVLPKEEQLFVDCMMTLNDMYETLNITVLMTTINKYKYILDREVFGEDELVYLLLYLILKSETGTWNDEIDILIEKINTKDMYKSRSTSEVLVRIYINISSHYLIVEKYNKALEILDMTVEFINVTKVYNRLPIIYMLLAKSYLGLGKKQKGKQFYQQALELAELLRLESLKLKIQLEKDKDVM